MRAGTAIDDCIKNMKPNTHRKRGWFNPDGSWHEHVGTRTDINGREDGRVERICEHGVGHPIGHRTRWEAWMGVHGCDGCCAFWRSQSNIMTTHEQKRAEEVAWRLLGTTAAGFLRTQLPPGRDVRRVHEIYVSWFVFARLEQEFCDRGIAKYTRPTGSSPDPWPNLVFRGVTVVPKSMISIFDVEILSL